MNADYKLVDAGKVYSDIHKVKVRPATGVRLLPDLSEKRKSKMC